MNKNLDEIDFEINLNEPLGMGITHPEEDHSHYPAVITTITPQGQAALAGIEQGMHIHALNTVSVVDQSHEKVLELITLAKKEKEKKSVLMMKCAHESLDTKASMQKHERFERQQIIKQFGPPTIELADSILQLHDEDHNGTLELNEITDWLISGSNLTKKERRELRLKSPLFYHSITYLESVARETALHGDFDSNDGHAEGFELNVDFLKKIFDSYDTNGQGSITAENFLHWMVSSKMFFFNFSKLRINCYHYNRL